jgi:hypothetical protein
MNLAPVDVEHAEKLIGTNEVRPWLASRLEDKHAVPKPDDDTPQPEPPSVRPPTLPPDFPDIPQNPSSELQPPPDPSATPDKVAGTTPAPAEPDTQGKRG